MMKTTDFRKQKSSKKIALMALAIIILLIGSYFAFAYATKSVWPFSSKEQLETQRGVNDIDYSSPSEEDIEQSQTGKQNNATKDEAVNSDNDDTTLSTVSVGVSYIDVVGDKVEIRAYMPGIIEGSGRCTAIATKGSLTVTNSSNAFIDATSTQCNPITIPRSSFPEGGVWNIVIKYESTTSKGTSDSEQVTL